MSRPGQSADVRHGFVDVGATRVYASSWTGPRCGATSRRLLLLHGLGGSTIHWALAGGVLAWRLRAAVTAIDLAGFGRTRARPAMATVSANADLVAGYLERYGSAEIVGNSMGGAIAVMVAAERPDLVERLVLVTPALPQPRWPYPPVPILPHNWPAAVPGLGPLAVQQYAASRSDETVVDDRLRRSFHDARRIDPEIRRQMIDLVRDRRRFAEANHAYAAAARSLFCYLAAPDGIARDMHRVRPPTLLIHGARDRLIPLVLARAATRERPDWRLKVIPECGHLPQLECLPEFVASFDEEPSAADSRLRRQRRGHAG